MTPRKPSLFEHCPHCGSVLLWIWGKLNMPARRLSGEGGEAMSAPLQLSFDDIVAEVRPRTLARGGNDGAVRLGRALLRCGLAEDAVPVALKMVLLLDAESGESR